MNKKKYENEYKKLEQFLKQFDIGLIESNIDLYDPNKRCILFHSNLNFKNRIYTI